MEGRTRTGSMIGFGRSRLSSNTVAVLGLTVLGCIVSAFTFRSTLKNGFHHLKANGTLVSGNVATALTVPRDINLDLDRPNETQQAVITLGNPSHERITLVAIETSCGCTAVHLEGDPTIAPGEKRQLMVRVSLGSLVGSYHSSVQLRCKDDHGAASSATVTIHGSVQNPLVLPNKGLDFGSVAFNAPDKVLSVLGTHTSTSRSWDEVSAANADANLGLSFDHQPDGQSQVNVKFHPQGLPVGNFHQQIKLVFTKNKVLLPGFVLLPIRAQVTGPIAVHPTSVYFGTIEPGKTVERDVQIQSMGCDLSGMSLEAARGDVQVEPLSVTPDHVSLRCRVVNTQAKTHPISESIHLNFLGGPLKVSIPVLGIVRGTDSGLEKQAKVAPPPTPSRLLAESLSQQK